MCFSRQCPLSATNRIVAHSPADCEYRPALRRRSACVQANTTIMALSSTASGKELSMNIRHCLAAASVVLPLVAGTASAHDRDHRHGGAHPSFHGSVHAHTHAKRHHGHAHTHHHHRGCRYAASYHHDFRHRHGYPHAYRNYRHPHVSNHYHYRHHGHGGVNLRLRF